MKKSTPNWLLLSQHTHTHTHTHTRLKRLRLITIALSMCGLLLGHSEVAKATIVPSGTFTEVAAATASLQDPVINCVMMEDPSTAVLKAIVYGEGDGTGTGQAGLFVEDGSGHTVKINLPKGAVQPSVRMSNTLPSAQSNILYQVLVCYATRTGGIYLAIYDLSNIGLPTFAITSTPTNSNANTALSNTAHGYPHIDMWEENTPGILNVGSCREFAIVWSESVSGGNSQTLTVYSTDVTTPSLSTPIHLAATNSRTPDVACITNIDFYGPAFYQHLIEVCYGEASSPTALTTALKVDEFNKTAYWVRSSGYPVTSFSGTPLSGAQNGVVYMPRIAAEALWVPDANEAKYVVAADVQLGSALTAGPYEVWGFSEAYPNGYSMSRSQFAINPDGICMSACVCAGITASNTIYDPAIGDHQYTLGLNNGASIYTRDVASCVHLGVWVGALFNPSTWFEVNSSSTGINNGQISKNFALSNCENTGDDIMSAWISGTTVYYKHSYPNTMAYRMKKNPAKAADVLAYPNPAVNELRFTNVDGGARYSILDMQGKVMLYGKTAEDGRVDIQNLVPGYYVVRLLTVDRTPYILRFTKS